MLPPKGELLVVSLSRIMTHVGWSSVILTPRAGAVQAASMAFRKPACSVGYSDGGNLRGTAAETNVERGCTVLHRFWDGVLTTSAVAASDQEALSRAIADVGRSVRLDSFLATIKVRLLASSG